MTPFNNQGSGWRQPVSTKQSRQRKGTGQQYWKCTRKKAEQGSRESPLHCTHRQGFKVYENKSSGKLCCSTIVSFLLYAERQRLAHVSLTLQFHKVQNTFQNPFNLSFFRPAASITVVGLHHTRHDCAHSFGFCLFARPNVPVLQQCMWSVAQIHFWDPSGHV